MKTTNGEINVRIDYSNLKLFQDYPDVVSITQLQKMLGIGKNKAYDLLKQQNFYYRKIGRAYKIAKESVIQYYLNTTA